MNKQNLLIVIFIIFFNSLSLTAMQGNQLPVQYVPVIPTNFKLETNLGISPILAESSIKILITLASIITLSTGLYMLHKGSENYTHSVQEKKPNSTLQLWLGGILSAAGIAGLGGCIYWQISGKSIQIGYQSKE